MAKNNDSATVNVQSLADAFKSLSPEQRQQVRAIVNPASPTALPPGSRKGTEHDGKCIRCGRGFVDSKGRQSLLWEPEPGLKLSVDCMKAHAAVKVNGHATIETNKYVLDGVSADQYNAMPTASKADYLQRTFRASMKNKMDAKFSGI